MLLSGEFELIARYFAPLAKDFPGAFGLRDDAAVIAPSTGCELVVKTDAIVGGVHFLADDPPELIARKALRVNLSDLAAKGAHPRAYMLALAMPCTTDEEWVASFAGGLANDQVEYGVHLIGGDTDSTPGPATIAIMAFGEVALDTMLRRSGAQPDDRIFVTGTIGDAALGLRSLQHEIDGLDAPAMQFLIDRYRLPLPRVALGPQLVGVATASIDVSDGLLADLRHLCETSHVAAHIDMHRVPLSSPARKAVVADRELLPLVLGGGDDYEILFTAPSSMMPRLTELSSSLDVSITEIGSVLSLAHGHGASVRVLDERGDSLTLGNEGWTHF